MPPQNSNNPNEPVSNQDPAFTPPNVSGVPPSISSPANPGQPITPMPQQYAGLPNRFIANRTRPQGIPQQYGMSQPVEAPQNAPYTAPYPNPVQTPKYEAGYGSYEMPKKKVNRLLLTLIVLVGFGILAGGSAIAYMHIQPTPDSVFRDAVGNSLSTLQVKQTMTTDSLGSQEVQYDVSKEKDPRVYAHSNINIFQSKFDAEQYASLKNSYFKINDDAGLLANASLDYKGKWMQISKNGPPLVPQDNVLTLGSLLPEGNTYLFGDWIFGNFSSKDKKDLQDYIINQKVFAYDASKVVKKHIGSEDVFVYTVTSDAAKKTEMNKRVAKIWGIDPSELEKSLGSLPTSDKGTLYVSIKTKRLIEADADASGIKVVNKYSDYNTLEVPAEPATTADYIKFIQAVNASGPSSSTSTNL